MKKTLALIAASALLASLAGCGGGNEPPNSGASTPAPVEATTDTGTPQTSAPPSVTPTPEQAADTYLSRFGLSTEGLRPAGTYKTKSSNTAASCDIDYWLEPGSFADVEAILTRIITGFQDISDGHRLAETRDTSVDVTPEALVEGLNQSFADLPLVSMSFDFFSGGAPIEVYVDMAGSQKDAEKYGDANVAVILIRVKEPRQ
ncbi:MAG: hypothetical protein LBN10_05870 [Propionibacteriaceae bacterium]|jgi:hypothetical protein|nr:hypothetical protein [Propionibacteriaceae bacterium]